MRTVKLLAMFI